MSWTCPHQRKDSLCILRKKACQPGAVGCVLEGKVKVVGKEGNLKKRNKGDRV